jgi:hypothetical protein
MSAANPLRSLHCFTLLAWLSTFLSLALLGTEDFLNIVHPYGLLLVVLLIVAVGSSLLVLCSGLGQVARGPRRGRAAGWLLFGLLPILGFSAMGGYAANCTRNHERPHNTPYRLMQMAGGSLMEPHAKYLYPHHKESERLVMFYGDGVDDPDGDLAEMEKHVARLEELTGRKLRDKVYWVRGSMVGFDQICNRGLAEGSSKGPAGDDDRHELAHAVLSQHETRKTDPPTLLIEGWAVSQETGGDRARLANDALTARGGASGDQALPEWAGSKTCLRDLTGPKWYHQSSGPVYSIGGAFVDFLIRRFGADKFVELYFTCKPKTFESDCQRLLGYDLDALERMFWDDVEGLMPKGNAGNGE